MNTKSTQQSQLDREIIAALQNGEPLLGKDGLLTSVVKRALESCLEGEIEAHMAEDASSNLNRRNGTTTKTVKHASGSFELSSPRDRDGSFTPEIVKKRQTILTDELDAKILSLYSLGMSYDDIKENLSQIYGVEISSSKISTITDKLLTDIAQWRNRPLEKVYTIIFLDAMFFKGRHEGKVVQRTIYNVMGINQDGHKDILGFYVADSEGSTHWLSVLNDLQNRGVEDIFIACVDGLTGFPEAIQSAFPNTEVQLCIVHQIRNSIKYVVSKDQKEFLSDLKTIYAADTKDMAEHNLLALDEKWGKKYPMVIQSWQQKWDHLSAYFKYSKPVRKLIYTTNPIEGFHRQIRKYTKTKGAFTSEDALFKLLYCAIMRIGKKWNTPIPNWGATISQLDIYFKGRLNVGL